MLSAAIIRTTAYRSPTHSLPEILSLKLEALEPKAAHLFQSDSKYTNE